jgi:hypothetical protein
MTTTTTTKDHTTYDAQGRAHTAPGCGTDAKAGDALAPTNDELIMRLRIEFGTDPAPAPTPLVKLANGREVTAAQVIDWNGREFGTGVACGLALGAVVLVIVHMIWPLI